MQILKHTPNSIPALISFTIADQSNTWLPHYIESLGINAQGSRYTTERQGYDTFFLCLTLEGGGYVQYGDRVFYPRPGDLLLFDCMDRHFYRTEGDTWRFLWIHFKGHACRPTFRHAVPEGVFFQHLADTECIRTLYDELCTLVSLRTVEADITVSERLNRLLMGIARHRCATDSPVYPPSIERTLAYMETHYGEELSVGELAARENYSLHYFTRLFTASVGTSPYRYLTRIRLRHARDMVLATSSSVEEIARAHNFPCCSRFIRLFAEQYGATPLQYRKQMAQMVGDLPLSPLPPPAECGIIESERHPQGDLP